MTLCFTILGAVDLGSDEGAARAARAISAAGAAKPDHRTLIRIMLGLASQASSAARRRVEEELMTFTYERDFIDDLVDKAADRAGEKSRIATKVADILKVFDARGLKPTEEQVKTVTTSTDLAQLDTWFDRALTVASADDVFKG